MKYSSERSKNQRLEEAKFESEKNLSEQTRLLAKTKEDLNNLEETKTALEKKLLMQNSSLTRKRRIFQNGK